MLTYICPCTTFDRGALVDELEGAAVLVDQRRAAANAALSYTRPRVTIVAHWSMGPRVLR